MCWPIRIWSTWDSYCSVRMVYSMSPPFPDVIIISPPEFLNHVLFCASVRLLLALAQLVLTPPWCLVCSISAVWTVITPHCLACRALWHHSRHRAPDHGVKWTRTRQELEGDWDKGCAIFLGLFFSTVPFFPLKLTQQYQEYLLHL